MKFDPRYKDFDIGDYTYGAPEVVSINALAQLSVGRFCSFARGVIIILDGEHRVDWVTTYPFSALFKRFTNFKGHPATKGDVTIGNDVWVGRNAQIMSGVTIGDGAVIGARAVVTKSVPPYSVCAGNPGEIKKKRFSDDIIEKLLEIQWWNFPEEKLVRAIPFMLSNDIEKFIALCEKIK
jgi:acetyltransferase-like isoleucine patch superfamily enzyme